MSTFQDDDTAGFEVDMVHRAEGPPAVDVLRERWKITVYPTDVKRAHLCLAAREPYPPVDSDSG